jgi:hypothetical protein
MPLLCHEEATPKALSGSACQCQQPGAGNIRCVCAHLDCALAGPGLAELGLGLAGLAGLGLGFAPPVDWPSCTTGPPLMTGPLSDHLATTGGDPGPPHTHVALPSLSLQENRPIAPPHFWVHSSSFWQHMRLPAGLSGPQFLDGLQTVQLKTSSSQPENG